MMSVFQNIQTKRRGLKCVIRVINHSGDDILTTYDPMVADSVSVATKDLQDFFSECITEFESKGKSLMSPNVFVKHPGAEDFDMVTSDEVLAPNFDVGLFEEVLIQPVPLTGG